MPRRIFRPLLLTLLLAGAIFLRWYLAQDVLAGDALALGPDGDDWVLATRALRQGGRSALLESNRYPLVPWLAARLADGLDLPATAALTTLSMVAGTLSILAQWAVARRLLPPALAALACLWMAAGSGPVALGVSTTAYPVFALGFLLLALSILRPGSPLSATQALVGTLLCAATLWQGGLVVLSVLPAALLTRRGWSLLGAGLGLLGAALLVMALHPHPHPPLLGALTEQVAMVLGSRFSGQIRAGGITGLHHLGNRAITGLFNLLYGSAITDTQAGFRVLWRRAIDPRCLRAVRYEIETELDLHVLRRGGRVVEVPVVRSRRGAGATGFATARDGLRILRRMLLGRVEPCGRRSS